MNKQQTNKIVDLQVHNFFNHDILDFKQYPDDEVANYFSRKSEKNSILDLTPVKGSLLYDEIKDIFITFSFFTINSHPLILFFQ